MTQPIVLASVRNAGATVGAQLLVSVMFQYGALPNNYPDPDIQPLLTESAQLCFGH